MKNIVRALALSLVATGAFAATQIHTSTVASTKVSAMPVPLCPPGSGNCMSQNGQ